MAKLKTVENERAVRLEALGFGKPIGERLPIEKWKPGLEVIGRLVAVKKLPDDVDKGGTVRKTGGHIFTLELDTGERVCYGAPTILWGIMEDLAIGTVLVILCTGKVPTKRGQDAWAFEVRAQE